MRVKLLSEHYLENISLKRGCRGSSESTHVKMSHCWKSHATAQLYYNSLEDSIHLAKDTGIDNVIIGLAPVLKIIFHQCVISYTCSQSNTGGSVHNRAISVRLATSI